MVSKTEMKHFLHLQNNCKVFKLINETCFPIQNMISYYNIKITANLLEYSNVFSDYVLNICFVFALDL